MKSIGIFFAFLFLAGLVRSCQLTNIGESVDHLFFIGDAYAVTAIVITIVIVVISCWWVGDGLDE
jgi:hypothetical protein